jgi:hypothetical protein
MTSQARRGGLELKTGLCAPHSHQNSFQPPSTTTTNIMMLSGSNVRALAGTKSARKAAPAPVSRKLVAAAPARPTLVRYKEENKPAEQVIRNAAHHWQQRVGGGWVGGWGCMDADAPSHHASPEPPPGAPAPRWAALPPHSPAQRARRMHAGALNVSAPSTRATEAAWAHSPRGQIPGPETDRFCGCPPACCRSLRAWTRPRARSTRALTQSRTRPRTARRCVPAWLQAVGRGAPAQPLLASRLPLPPPHLGCAVAVAARACH